jgi:hypothetical protein
MANTIKTSLLVPSQLPEYIRDDPDYEKFVAFITAYYEWLEQNNNVLDYSKKILTYQDIDQTTDQFLQYYVRDFLPYFPQEILIDKNKLIKFARELYQSKGTIASYKFLFRVLYNSDFDVFYTKEAVLKPSDGEWYIAKSLKLSTSDERFLDIANYRIFGETTKTIATIETSVLSGNKIEIFISNIERLFQSGEYARIVDNNLQDVIIDGQNLRSKIVGQISQININPNYRGSFYKTGDPVVVSGGSNSITGVGATAEVDQTTKGSVKSVSVLDGGFGYRTSPNTTIKFSDLNAGAASPVAVVGTLTPYLLPEITITDGGIGYSVDDIVYTTINSNPFNFGYVSLVDGDGAILRISYNSGISSNSVIGATASISSSNSAAYGANVHISSVAGSAVANVTLVPTNTIQFGRYVPIGNATYSFLSGHPTANANTRLLDSLSFISFETYPISSIFVSDQGGGITQTPTVTALSHYDTDLATSDTDQANTAVLSSLGILAPIQVVEGGIGYNVGDQIVFSNGSGYGAHANVTSVTTSGSITGIEYVSVDSSYPLGGMGYTNLTLPTLSVNSSNVAANGASLVVNSILGEGARFLASTDRAGSITSIKLINNGEDYVATPNVSLKVQDIVVSGLDINQLPMPGDFVYQGISSEINTYQAYVDSITAVELQSDPAQSLYNIRLFDYSSIPNVNLPLIIDRIPIQFNIANRIPTGMESTYPFNSAYNIYGFVLYGDGTAKATAKFLNGLVIGQGEYLNSRGQLSSFDVLQNERYNNFTYQITVEKEIEKYRDVLLNLLHPSGLKVLGRYALRCNTQIFETSSTTATYQGIPLDVYTGYPASSAVMVADFVNKSNNIIQFTNLAGANIGEFIFANTTTIKIETPHGPNVSSVVLSVDSVSNTIVVDSNTWLTFANVANVSVLAGTNTINILSLTGLYDIINNADYSHKSTLSEIVFIGDTIKVSNNSVQTVTYIDYNNNVVYVANNFTSNSDSMLSVNRNINSNKVTIWGPLGIEYIPELTTESGLTLTTEDGKILLLG